MAVFGPVLDGTGSWGLAEREGEDNELRAVAADDPMGTSGSGKAEVRKVPAGFVRAR